jgi:hypothetical protein
MTGRSAVGPDFMRALSEESHARCVFASPYDEGDAFVIKRGEGDASAAWIGHCQPFRERNSRSKSLDASGGGEIAAHATDTPT